MTMAMAERERTRETTGTYGQDLFNTVPLFETFVATGSHQRSGSFRDVARKRRRGQRAPGLTAAVDYRLDLTLVR
jgi:hypothetical protein